MSITLREPVGAFIAIGANLGDATHAVHQAFDALARLPQTQLVGRSRLYRSAPYLALGPDFINAVAGLQTRLTAPDLLAALQGLEKCAGRQRPFPNAPRTLDLDLILFGQAMVDSPLLTVPHPRWRERAFVLLPMQDVNPDGVSPLDLARVADQVIHVLSAERQ